MESVVDILTYTRSPEAFEDHAWGGSSFGAVDPEKEVAVHADAIETDQETLAEVYAEKDQDWSDGMKQRDAELRYKIKLEIEREKWESEERERAGLGPKESGEEGDIGSGD